MPKTQKERLEELRQRRLAATAGGGEKAIQNQHEKGKLTARERVEILLDPNSFIEYDQFAQSEGEKDIQTYPGDGVVTGAGRIDGRQIFVFAQDFTVMGGSLGEVHARKICMMMENARKVGCPVVGITIQAARESRRGLSRWAGMRIFFITM